MRRRGIDLTTVVLVAALAAPAQGGEASAPAPSRERVREMLVLAGVARNGEMLVDQIIRTMRGGWPGVPAELWDEMKSAIGSGEFLDLLVPVYQKQLSAADVEAAIAYWKSEPGRRFASAQPAIMAESEKAGRQWALVLVERMKARLAAAPRRELHSGFIDKTPP